MNSPLTNSGRSTRRPSALAWSRIAASCMSTATACSARSWRPRTWSRRPSCAPGAGARHTRVGRRSALFYRFAANACLDAPDKRPRRPSSKGEITWLQPYPDELLEQLPDRREGPEEVALAKETVELAFFVAIQHLAPLPRAVLRDDLDCSAKETARLLETTEASVNSALQRARGGLR
jgi:DNA-directed RNA polymerase specialized sigma24 family protein